MKALQLPLGESILVEQQKPTHQADHINVGYVSGTGMMADVLISLLLTFMHSLMEQSQTHSGGAWHYASEFQEYAFRLFAQTMIGLGLLCFVPR